VGLPRAARCCFIIDPIPSDGWDASHANNELGQFIAYFDEKCRSKHKRHSFLKTFNLVRLYASVTGAVAILIRSGQSSWKQSHVANKGANCPHKPLAR
jgi:hypothetical protein